MQALLDTIAALDLPSDACRVFHGRGGAYPGCEQWTLDAYPPVWVLTSFAPASDEALAVIGAALAARWQQLAPGQALNWVFQQRQGGRAASAVSSPALPAAGGPLTRLMAGSVPQHHVVTEAGLRYRVQLLQGQNHGLFLDMAQGRRWVRDWVCARMQGPVSGPDGEVPPTPRLKVLNLFAYTCAFSVGALHAGARQVTNLDISHGALATGQHNHRLNGLETGASFLAHDLFTSWGKVNRSGPYDLVIVDPPSYQRGSFVASKDYARVLRRLPDLLAPDGHALLCLNAPELGMDFLLAALQAEAPTLTLLQRLPNPPVFADVAPDRALKVLVCKAPGLALPGGALSSPNPL